MQNRRNPGVMVGSDDSRDEWYWDSSYTKLSAWGGSGLSTRLYYVSYDTSDDYWYGVSSGEANTVDVTGTSTNVPKVYLVPIKGTGKIVISQSSGTTQRKTTITNGDFIAPDTYFPMLTSSITSFQPTDLNPGYFVSGADEDTDTTVRNKGDIIFSTNYFSYSNLIYSNNSTSSYSGNESKLQVVTKNAESGGQYVRIEDSYNKGNMDNAHTKLKQTYPNTKTVEQLGFEKYDAARKQLGESFNAASNNKVYGFHFKEASVNIDNVMTADAVKINGVTKYDYQLPRNCVDLSIKETGYIDFFGGSFYKNNNSFFTLNQVVRGTDSKITEIREIQAIYEKQGGGYVYDYKVKDKYGNLSELMSTAGTKVDPSKPLFEAHWIRNVDLLQNTSGLGLLDTDYDGALYYFEIPVNGGDEFAIGAADGCKGAYICYLDVGSSPVQKTYDNETYRTKTAEYKYPKGVDFLPTGQQSSSYNPNVPTAAVSLGITNRSGRVSYSSNGTTLTLDNTNISGIETKNVFADSGVEVKQNSSTVNLVAKTPSVLLTKSTTDEVYNSTTKTKTTTVVTMYDTASGKTFDGTHNVKTQVTRVDEAGQETEDDPVYTSSTETITFDDNNVVIKYNYTSPEGNSVTTKRKLSEFENETGVGKYLITITVSEKMHLLIDNILSTFNGSKLNNNEMTNNLRLTIAPTT